MAGLKEIRRRIASVKNTKQITRAMKLVSAAKLRRAQDAAIASRNFRAKLHQALAPVVLALPRDFDHRFVRSADGTGVRRAIVVSGERGLCGAYNTNVLKSVQSGEKISSLEVVGVGRRTVSSAKRLGWNLISIFESFPEDPAKWPIDEIARQTTEDYLEGKCSEVVLYYTKFISAMTQQVTMERLLPLDPEELRGSGESEVPNTKFDSPPIEMFQTLVPLYLRSKIREAALESKASEHAARMSAMDSATNNASDLIDRLRLFYNRARQSTITTELIDIVGGAEAVK